MHQVASRPTAASSAHTMSRPASGVVEPARQRRQNGVVAALEWLRIVDHLAAKARLELVQTAPVAPGGAGNAVAIVDLRRLWILRGNSPKIVSPASLVACPPHGLILNQETRSMGSVLGR